VIEIPSSFRSELEPVVGIEPTTYGLRNRTTFLLLFFFNSKNRLLFVFEAHMQPLVTTEALNHPTFLFY